MTTEEHDYSPKRIAIYNHKGGVGKTTLTINIASALAAMGKKVLLVDSDPQCNLTSHLFDADTVDKLLDSSDSDDGRTLWSALRPIHDGTSSLNLVEPYETAVPNLFLIPGDISLSNFENGLSNFWNESLQSLTRGLRGTTALSLLITEILNKSRFDYVFFDAGPNIGPLNRVILLDCDYFIVPSSCDLFSLRAIRTLGFTIASWVRQWRLISNLAPSGSYRFRGTPFFLGYVPQRIRVYGGRPTSQNQLFLSRIRREIVNDLIPRLRAEDGALATKSIRGLNLGEVRDFGSLVQLSQESGLPLKDTLGGSAQQREQAKRTFDRIARALIARAAE